MEKAWRLRQILGFLKKNMLLIFTITIIISEHNKVIFVLTYDRANDVVTSSNVYRSTNYGNTFSRISSIIGNGATLLNKIFIDPENHTRVRI